MLALFDASWLYEEMNHTATASRNRLNIDMTNSHEKGFSKTISLSLISTSKWIQIKENLTKLFSI
jgi:hypothetical protein